MPFAAGKHLRSYEIVALIGVGGMGEVYKARDTRLDRMVAIKVLADRVAHDPDYKQRFAREAKAISSLNHPHICTLYDVGSEDGIEFLVMEFLEGETVAQRLAKGAIPLPQVLRHAVEIAEALDRAHRHGVTHRDLKPGNIMLTKTGAKLLDFGLAKLNAQSPVQVSGSVATETEQPDLTASGTILGTLQYMAPEQVEGKAVDHRADIFAFGAIVYEMATGEKAFEGESQASLIGAILRDEPRPVSALQPLSPPAFDALITTCLAKDPDDRWQSVGDVGRQLRLMQSSSSHPSTPMPAAIARKDAIPVAGRRTSVIASATAVLVLAAAGGIYLLLSRPVSAPAASPSLRDFQISQLTTSGIAVHPAISPDGRYVVYVQPEAGDPPGVSLWVRQIATSSTIRIVPPEPGVVIAAPTVTSDGNFVDFVRGQGLTPALWRVPLLGGEPSLLAERIASPVGWSPDGRQMAFVRVFANASELVVADADGGRERVLARRQEPQWFLQLNATGRPPVRPVWSPDGSVIAVFAGGSLVFVDTATGAEVIRDLGSSRGLPQGLAWLGPESLVLSQSETSGQRVQLWRLSYPGASLSPLTNDLSSYIGVDVDGTRDSLVTSRRETRISLWVGDAAGRDGAEVVRPSLFGGNTPWLSWAGERLLYDATGGGRAAVAAVVPGGGEPQEVVANARRGTGTSDGGTIVFVREGLWKADASGRQPVQLLAGGAGEPRLSADDRHVIFVSGRSGLQSLWMVPITGGEPVEIARENAGDFDVSAAGLLLFRSWNDTREYFVVCELPACANRREFGLPANFVGVFAGRIRWSADGRDIAYIDTSGMNLWRLPLDGSAPSPITRFADDAGRGRIEGFAWSRDGERLAILRMAATEDIVLLRGVRQ